MSVNLVANAIKARLVEQLITVPQANSLPALARYVYSQREYTAVAETNMVTPSVAVIYTGYTPGSKIRPVGGIQDVAFGWLVVANVRNARNAATGEGVQDDASPIIDAIFAAMLGWTPIPKFRPMQLEPAPGAALTDAGFGYYPIAFSTTATYRGTAT